MNKPPILYKAPEDLINQDNGQATKALNARLNLCIDCMAGLADDKRKKPCMAQRCTARNIGRKYYDRLRAGKAEGKDEK